MALQNLSSPTFGAKPGGPPAPLAPRIRRSLTQHNKPRKPPEKDPRPCGLLAFECWCSVITNDLPRSTHTRWSSFASSGCSQFLATATQAAGHTTTSSTPAASTTPSFTSPSTANATPGSRTLPSTPYSTTTQTTSINNGLSGPSPALSTTGPSEGANGNTPGSSSSKSQDSQHHSGPTSSSSIPSPTVTISLPHPSPLPGGTSSSTASPAPPESHRPNIGAIVGITFGALIAALCIALALFLLLRRRARRRTKWMFDGSPWERLKPHVYDDAASRPASSVWTWFGFVPIDPNSESKREHGPHSPDLRFAEKDEDSTASERLGALSSRPPPRPSPAPAKVRQLSEDASVQSLREGPLRVSRPSAPDAPSSSSELLALAGMGFATINASNHGEGGLERTISGLSRITASSGDVQSVDAL